MSKSFLVLSLFFSVSVNGAMMATSLNDVGVYTENQIVRAYIHDADSIYKSGIGRTGSSIINYKTQGMDKAYYVLNVEERDDRTPNWAEKPDSVRLFVPGASRVVVSTSPNFTNTYSAGVENGYAYFDNLIPKTVYWYAALNESNDTLSIDLFKMLGRVRMIRTRKILNVRDIGGWKCGTSGRLAYGKIIRGACLDGANTSNGGIEQDDKSELINRIGVKANLDLRGSTEIETKNPLGSTVSYTNIAIPHYVYLLKNNQSGVNSYEGVGKCLNTIISNLKNNKCTYINCSWGADRTGTLIAIIEALCGVSEANIVKDWELTSFNAVCYHKFIDEEELSYVENKTRKTAELRSFFKELYNNYGGKSNASLQTQVKNWLSQKVASYLTYSVDETVTLLNNYLVDKNLKYPIVVRCHEADASKRQYSVTNENTEVYDLVPINNNGGSTHDELLFSTERISCSGYKYLLVNVNSKMIGTFYDSKGNKIKDIGNSSLPEETIIFNRYYSQYSVPSNAATVKFVMAKSCDWTAVLSVSSLKNK